MIANERGLTLVEILVAAALIGIGLSGVLAVVPIASYGLQEGNQRSTATFLADERLEAVRNATWTGTPAVDCLGVSASAAAPPTTTTCTGHAGSYGPFPDEADVANFTGYSRTVRVTACSVAPGCGGVTDAGMRLVTVAVSYRPMTGMAVAAAGTTKAVSVTLLIAQR